MLVEDLEAAGVRLAQPMLGEVQITKQKVDRKIGDCEPRSAVDDRSPCH